MRGLNFCVKLIRWLAAKHTTIQRASPLNFLTIIKTKVALFSFYILRKLTKFLKTLAFLFYISKKKNVKNFFEDNYFLIIYF